MNWCIFSLDMDYVNLYLMHRPTGDQILETYDALLALKEKCLAKYVESFHNNRFICIYIQTLVYCPILQDIIINLL